MARQLRLQFPGAIYHVISRGNNREPIVRDDVDVSAFLHSVALTCQRYAWRVFAWCVMPNHYHLVLQTLQPTLSTGMRRHNSTYAQLFNQRHGRVGHVFQGRFKSLVVAKDDYLLAVLRYVELNPVRARLVAEPTAWPWSSIHCSLGATPAPAWSAVTEVWKLFGVRAEEAVANYRAFLREGIRSEQPLPIQGSIIGDADDAARVLNRVTSHSIAEIPRSERRVLPTLAAIFAEAATRNHGIQLAYFCGYSLRAIGDHTGVHYSTVSRIAIRAHAAQLSAADKRLY